METPYHEGERAVQERAGEATVAVRNGRVISSAIPERAMGFVSQQPMAVLASADAEHQPWASLLLGVPGFLHADARDHLTADLTRAWPHEADPFRDNIRHDPRFGMLLIDLATRRRLRINGRATERGDVIDFAVETAYPNCPKYIQRRHLSERPAPRDELLPEPVRGSALTAAQQALIAGADTLFVSSLHPEQGADASHRGGNPGFARILDDTTLRIPDYPGNSMFNTLGNFAVHPAGGVLFPDFAGHRTLQLVGEVEIQWDMDDPDGRTGGTGRFWDFHIAGILELPLPALAAWELLDTSPFNP